MLDTIGVGASMYSSPITIRSRCITCCKPSAQALWVGTRSWRGGPGVCEVQRARQPAARL